MPAALDACIASIFEPGNPGNATDSGSVTVPHYSGFLLLEETIDHFELNAEDEYTDWLFTAAFGYLTVTVAGTWSGAIAIDEGIEGPPGTITFFSTLGPIISTNGTFILPKGGSWRRLRMTGYVSGTALIYVPGFDFSQHILIEEGGATVGKLKLE